MKFSVWTSLLALALTVMGAGTLSYVVAEEFCVQFAETAICNDKGCDLTIYNCNVPQTEAECYAYGYATKRAENKFVCVTLTTANTRCLPAKDEKGEIAYTDCVIATECVWSENQEACVLGTDTKSCVAPYNYTFKCKSAPPP